MYLQIVVVCWTDQANVVDRGQQQEYLPWRPVLPNGEDQLFDTILAEYAYRADPTQGHTASHRAILQRSIYVKTPGICSISVPILLRIHNFRVRSWS